MNQRIFALTLGAMLFALCVSVEAQQPKNIPRIGFLSPGGDYYSGRQLDAFRQGLRSLGYDEGKNIFVGVSLRPGEAGPKRSFFFFLDLI